MLTTADGDAIRRAREARGLSRHALAAQAGITRATLFKIETGAQGGSEKSRLALAKALDVPLHAITRQVNGQPGSGAPQ